MEFMLPRFFGWPQLWGDNQRMPSGLGCHVRLPSPPTPFPALARWYAAMRTTPAFASVRNDIYSYWQGLEAAGQWLDETITLTPTLSPDPNPTP